MADLDDFVTEGGDDLLQSRQCPSCKGWFPKDEATSGDDPAGGLKCPICEKPIEVE